MSALLTTWRLAGAEALANQRGFWTQFGVMIANDIVWVIFWFLFFREVGEVRGWDADRVLVLLAVLTTAAGFVLGLLANARQIGRLAADGGLDAALGLPTPTLAHLLVRRIDTTHVGDVAFGIVLFVALGNPSPGRTAAFLLALVCAVLAFVGFLVLMGSLSFFVGRNEAGDLGFQALLLFSSYPVDIFGGVVRFMLYAVVPAGFVTGVPTRLIDDFDPLVAAGGFAVSALFLVAGVTTFHLGLRRYTSGAGWTPA